MHLVVGDYLKSNTALQRAAKMVLLILRWFQNDPVPSEMLQAAIKATHGRHYALVFPIDTR